jgi:hypothetical protein
MEIVIHCGFPKTGTTALQKWLTCNAIKLSELGIIYPLELRDQEGIAHHNLNSLVEQGPNIAAARITDISIPACCKKLVLSAEGLSNILGREDESGLSFFLDFFDYIARKGHKVSVLFTLRSIDKYIQSIVIQNILYDGLHDAPSSFASHTLSTLSRAYSSLATLMQTNSIMLFEYSSDVNQQIIEYIIESSLADFGDNLFVSREHSSPDLKCVQFFMWLNSICKKTTPDFHSFLRFHPSAQAVFAQLSSRLSQSAISNDHYLLNWEPSAELVDSFLRYSNASWSHSLSYKARGESYASTDNFKLLRRHLGRDLQAIIPHSLIQLDHLHWIASNMEFDFLFREALNLLLEQGSKEYGQDFHSQLEYV